MLRVQFATTLNLNSHLTQTNGNMWLLNANTAQLEDFFEERIPPYAILSHTWGKKEISFRDLTQDPEHTSHPAYHKIRESCRLANESGVDYVSEPLCQLVNTV